MENINYSLQEYFEKKYPKQKYKVKCYDGSICEELGLWEFYGDCGPDGVGYEEFSKLINDLRNLFIQYNLFIYEEGGYNLLGEKNKVSYSNEFEAHVFWHELTGQDVPGTEYYYDCGQNSIFEFKGYSNITPEIFLVDIKQILEKYSVKPTKPGPPPSGLNSVASIFLKYMELKTPPHIIKLRKSHQDDIKIFRERENKINLELKHYKDIKELQDMKHLVEKNKSLIEENIKLVEKEDIRNKVQHWLENNSGEINFKIGKELYDILM
jgi:hypothetical protein